MKKAVFGKVAASLLLSAGVFASSSASAETLVFDAAGNATFSALHAVAGAYADDYLFSVTPANLGWPTGTAIAGKTKVGANRLYNYGITAVDFFRVNADSSHTLLGSSATTGSSAEFFPLAALTAGNYGFTIHGITTLAGLGGSYAGNLNLVTAPVPEPATYGMLATGLGLLAFTTRRKKSDKLG